MRYLRPLAVLLFSSALTAPLIARADDSGSTLTFSTGATITLPPGWARPTSESESPNGLVTVRGFLVNENNVFAVNEIALAGKTCEDVISGEWAQMQRNQAITDPNFKLLFRLNKLERQTIGESVAVYSELDTRNPQEVRTGAPYHAGAGYLLCQRDTLVNLMLWLKSGSLDRGLREQFIAIAKSLRAKPR